LFHKANQMKTTLKLMAILLTACAATQAQVAPEATGPSGLPISGNLQYALRYSQAATFYGGALGTGQDSIVSGDLDYSNSNARLPFSARYGGGYSWVLAGPGENTGVYQHLAISQGFVQRNWNIQLNDDISYTPESPTTGFTGIPGSGEPVGGTGSSSTPPSQTILTLNTRTLGNFGGVQIGYNINSTTSLNLGAHSDLLYYPDGNATDTNGAMENAGLTWRLNTRTSLSGLYTFSHFSYGASASTGSIPISSDTSTALFGYEHRWTRQLSTNISAGPQWLNSSDSAFVPSSTTLAIQASLNYTLRFGTASLTYNQGSTGGSGYLVGTEIDSVTGGFSRNFGRNVTLGLTGAYTRNSGYQEQNQGETLVATNVVTNATFGGAVVSWRLSKYLSIYGNYSGIDQSLGLTTTTGILDQFYQVLSFGIAYSPRETHLSQ
jgi:hypothetical protein